MIRTLFRLHPDSKGHNCSCSYVVYGLAYCVNSTWRYSFPYRYASHTWEITSLTYLFRVKVHDTHPTDRLRARSVCKLRLWIADGYKQTWNNQWCSVSKRDDTELTRCWSEFKFHDQVLPAVTTVRLIPYSSIWGQRSKRAAGESFWGKGCEGSFSGSVGCLPTKNSLYRPIF